MRISTRVVATTMVIMLAVAHVMSAQAQPDIWKAFAERAAVGAELRVRLSDGRRLRATLVGVSPDAVLLQPKTRVPVPVRPVPYADIVGMELARDGIGVGKAVAIGVGAGVGGFFATMLVFLAIALD